jgi:hypothetical protein
MNTENLNSTLAEEKVGLDRAQEFVGESKPQRIGGFLIVLAVGLFITLFQNFAYSLGSIAPLIRKELWERYTDPESTAYHPYWKSIIIYDALTSLLILFMNIVMLLLFFRKKKVFPKLIVVLFPFYFVVNFTSYFVSGLIPAIAESEEYAKLVRALIVQFVGLHIWIPYFLLSKRVVKTFVR